MPAWSRNLRKRRSMPRSVAAAARWRAARSAAADDRPPGRHLGHAHLTCTWSCQVRSGSGSPLTVTEPPSGSRFHSSRYSSDAVPATTQSTSPAPPVTRRAVIPVPTSASHSSPVSVVRTSSRRAPAATARQGTPSSSAPGRPTAGTGPARRDRRGTSRAARLRCTGRPPPRNHASRIPRPSGVRSRCAAATPSFSTTGSRGSGRRARPARLPRQAGCRRRPAPRCARQAPP